MLLAAGAIPSPAAPAAPAAVPAVVPTSAAAPLRRVILLSCDALSASHLRAYARRDGPSAAGGPGGASAFAPARTACFDSLAGEGVLFRHCLASQGWTLSSHLTMLTGLLPGAHRAGADRPLPGGAPLLTELLKAAGFATGFFPTGNAWLTPAFGYDRGADTYRQFSIKGSPETWVAEWCDRQAGTAGGGPARPFFVFAHFMDVHTRSTEAPFPYWPILRTRQMELRHSQRQWPPRRTLAQPRSVVSDLGEEVEQWDVAAYDPALLRQAYDACVTGWDADRLRRLVSRLARAGHLRDTLLILTADHGEEIGEHGGFQHRQPYVEVREVPLLMIWPGRLPRGAVVDEPVGLVDVAPTVLDLAGLAPPPRVQGVSLRPLLEDPAADLPDRDFLIDGHYRGLRLELSALVGVVDGRRWSLVASVDTSGCAGAFVPERVAAVRGLYDLDADPGERRDLSALHPAVAADLAARMQAQFAANARLAASIPGAAGRAGLTAEQKRQLRALGY